MWQNAQPIVRHSSHGGDRARPQRQPDQHVVAPRRAARTPASASTSTSDTEVIAALIAQHPADDLADAVADTMSQRRGRLRRRRPLASGHWPASAIPTASARWSSARLDDAWVLASETCALDIVGARLVRELEPGELVVIDEQGARFAPGRRPEAAGRSASSSSSTSPAPTSMIEGQALHDVRAPDGRAAGRRGAGRRRHRHRRARLGHARPRSATPSGSGIPYGEGLVKNRYVGRTFIQPDQELRERGVQLKFNPLRTALDGKRVVVVDDSIVRGTTTRKLVQLLRRGGRASRCTCASPRRRSCRPASTGSTWPTRAS